MQISKSKWFLPLFAVGIGLAMLAAMWIGGDPSTGLFFARRHGRLRCLDPVRRT